MKKINIALFMLLGFITFISCDSDRDSNPTLLYPTSFVLNTPPYVNAVYDLKNTQSVELTATQPEYGFTAATNYAVQVSLSGNFTNEEEFVTLSTIYTTARMEVNASEIANAMVALLGIENEEDFPTDEFALKIRLMATISGSDHIVYSNSIELPRVIGYYALPELTMPDNLFIVGSMTDWDWGNSIEMIPTNSHPEIFWRMVYLEAGDELKFNSAKAWDGSEFGYDEEYFTNESSTYAGLEDADGNIKVNNAGWYLVVVTVETAGSRYIYQIDFLQPNVYSTGDPAGGFDVFEEANLYSVPASKDGEFVSPTFIADGQLRICVKLDGVEWWQTEFVILGGEIEYRGTGDDQERVNVSAGQRAYLNFTQGTGYVK
ncbi:MAG: SusF/SusE family outer membrane protein [Tannerellaceae bacterium]|nr:SusF/SusE family outer membrane protein [Tannerellaceae bacterium]